MSVGSSVPYKSPALAQRELEMDAGRKRVAHHETERARHLEGQKTADTPAKPKAKAETRAEKAAKEVAERAELERVTREAEERAAAAAAAAAQSGEEDLL